MLHLCRIELQRASVQPHQNSLLEFPNFSCSLLQMQQPELPAIFIQGASHRTVASPAPEIPQ